MTENRRFLVSYVTDDSIPEYCGKEVLEAEDIVEAKKMADFCAEQNGWKTRRIEEITTFGGEKK